MPFGDGTGPIGTGPMTGRGSGFRAGYDAPGFADCVRGRGWFGRGGRFSRGGGRGWRHWYHATGLPGWARGGPGLPAYGGWGAEPHYGNQINPAFNPRVGPREEADSLKDQARAMEEELKEIRERIRELETKGRKEEE